MGWGCHVPLECGLTVPVPQCQIIYPRQQLLTLRELEMIGFVENNVSRLSLLLRQISR